MQEERFAPYVIPGSRNEDWMTLLSLVDVQRNRLTGRAMYQVKRLEEFVNGITNESLLADYDATVHNMLLIIRYPLVQELHTHCSQMPGEFNELLKGKIVECINFPALKTEDKLALLKLYSLRNGISDEVLSQFSLSADEKREVISYFNTELIKFLFYENFPGIDDFKHHITTLQDNDELRAQIFKVIGSRLLRSSLQSEGHESVQILIKMKADLNEKLKYDNYEGAKVLAIELADKYIDYFRENGFSRYTKCTVNPLNLYFSNERREAWSSVRPVSRAGIKPEDTIHIVHGGGFLSLLSFLKKEYDGYHLDNPGVGLQVHPYTDKGAFGATLDDLEARTRYDYAMKAAHFIDQPARLTADVEARFVDRTHREYEGGFRGEYLEQLSNLTLTNYETGAVYTADNVKELIHNVEHGILADESPDIRQGPH